MNSPKRLEIQGLFERTEAGYGLTTSEVQNNGDYEESPPGMRMRLNSETMDVFIGSSFIERAREIVSEVVAALFAYFEISVISLSFASSISGAAGGVLQARLGVAVAMSLLGTTVVGGICVTFSRAPYHVPSPDLFYCPFLASMVTNMATVIPTDTEAGASEFLATFMASHAISTICVGVSIAAAGRVRGMRLADFIPYPVICGLLAGIGVVMLVQSYHLSHTDSLYLAGNRASTALFGMLAAVANVRRMNPVLSLVPLLVGSTLLFYVWLHHLDSGLGDEAMYAMRAADMLFDYRPLQIRHWWLGDQRSWAWGMVRWDVVVNQCLPVMASLAALVVLKASLLFPAYEKAFGYRLDPEFEMTLLGVANIVGGMLGGVGVGPQISTSTMLRTMSPHHSATAIATGSARTWRSPAIMVCAFALGWCWGISWLSFLPKFVFSGLLFAQGAALVWAWLVLPWRRLPWREWAVVALIVGSMFMWGMLGGVIIGLGCSTLLFVQTFALAGAIRFQGSVVTFRSATERTQQAQKYLDRHGELVQLLQLQGYLFFGNATTAVTWAVELLEGFAPANPQFLVLDLSQDILKLSTASKGDHFAG